MRGFISQRFNWWDIVYCYRSCFFIDVLICYIYCRLFYNWRVFYSCRLHYIYLLVNYFFIDINSTYNDSMFQFISLHLLLLLSSFYSNPSPISNNSFIYFSFYYNNIYFDINARFNYKLCDYVTYLLERYCFVYYKMQCCIYCRLDRRVWFYIDSCYR